MSADDYPVLDGIAPSWADITVSLTPYGGELLDVKDIAAINTGTTVEVGEQRGASGGRVMRRTTGSVSHEASMTLYKSGWNKLLRKLKEAATERAGQKRVGLVHFDIFIQHIPPDESDEYEIKILGCRLMGRSANSAEGTDADQVEVPLSVGQIVDVIDGEEIVML